ncbi:MAG: phosphopyruvate hydratase [Candidatus Micrarchaeota archaeon]
MAFKIKSVFAREILDSRGNPTVEVEVRTQKGVGRAAAPSGASTGSNEALELRDGGKRYDGKGVLTAVENVNKKIARRLVGKDARKQRELDNLMIEMDGTSTKSRLGANALVATSLALARAAADSARVPLFKYLDKNANLLPVPLMNVINGGKHAGNSLAIQEFIIIPAGAPSFREALRMGAEVYHELGRLLQERYGLSSRNVGDEGGYAPSMLYTREAMDALADAIRASGYSRNVFMGIDAAASSFYKNRKYSIDGRELEAERLLEFYEQLARDYPLISIEDPFYEEGFSAFAELTRKIGGRTQVIGDDLFVTNAGRLQRGIDARAGNAVLLKINQIGTLTEMMDVATLAKKNSFRTIISHRSGETEDASIADIAVGISAGQIKAGAPARGERTAKYNQLLRIEEMLGKKAKYSGRAVFGR